MGNPGKMRRGYGMVSRPVVSDIPIPVEVPECEIPPTYTADNEAMGDIVE